MPSWSIDTAGRFLRRDGEPWFLVGDTAWELFRHLSEDEVDAYVRTRAEQGFNTVLAVAFGCRAFDGLYTPTVEGELPFRDTDLARPNEAYWRRVDETIRHANSHGLVVGLLPSWGMHWYGLRDGSRPPLFTPDSASAYASWIAERYQHDDIIWVLGGDFPVTTDTHRTIIETFATRIRKVVGHSQLVSFHPPGEASSTECWPDAEWLDFHMIQSGHRGWHIPNYQLVEQDYELQPPKPTLDGEPNYDQSPVMDTRWQPVPGHHFDEHDARRAAYHAVFAGACGHVYGCQEVWQFHDPAADRPLLIGGDKRDQRAGLGWKSAIDLQGARQMGHLARLMREVGFGDWEPAQALIPYGRGMQGKHQRALAHRHTPGALVYAPAGRDVAVDLSRWPGQSSWSARWWDPRGGSWTATADQNEGTPRGSHFVVPHPFSGSDGVLHLKGTASEGHRE